MLISLSLSWGAYIIVIEPSLATTIDPIALTPESVLIEVESNSILLASVPAALVLAPISPDKFAFAVALVLLKLAYVLFTVGPL